MADLSNLRPYFQRQHICGRSGLSRRPAGSGPTPHA